MRPLLIAALALVTASTAAAQLSSQGTAIGRAAEQAEPGQVAGNGGLVPGMRRLDTANDSRGWEAVGRLELGGKGFCTAALIEPQLLLTAAHCLWDKTTGITLDLAEIEFRAGWRNGRAVAYRKIRRAAAHPDYIFSSTENLAQVPHDLALLELDSPIRLPNLTPFPIGPMPHKGDEVGIVSYARMRAEAPALQDRCKVLSSQQKVAVMSCDVDFGSSGAPVFSFVNGRPEIVSVVTAKAEMNGEKVSLGMDMAEALVVLRREIGLNRLGGRPGKLPQIGDPPRQGTSGGMGASDGTSNGPKILRSRPSPDGSAP